MRHTLVFVISLAVVARTGAGRPEASALIDAVDRYRRADDVSKTAQAQASIELQSLAGSLLDYSVSVPHRLTRGAEDALE
jgi:hypothetical protein